MNTPTAYARFMQRLEATPQATFHLGLEVMQQAVHAEGLSHPAPYVIIVAGTNGKGTVAASLSHLCDAFGLRTTLLTSPHLVEFRERIRIQGVPISAEALTALGEKLLPVYGAESGRSPRALSYFELSVLHGLAAARDAHSDVLIMEVGLGGRLDATNVVESDLAVITSISLDHTDLLGSTLPEIVREKAAVARCGRPVIHHARQGGREELSNALEQIGAHPTIVERGEGAREQNLALAAAAFEHVLTHFERSATEEWTAQVLEDFQWPGRLSWERDRLQRPVLVDGAHNAESAAELARYLKELGTDQRFEAVVALSAGRKAEEVLAPLAPYVSAWHVCAPDFARVNSAADTASSLQAFEEAQQRVGLPSRLSTIHASVEDALQAAEQSAAARNSNVLVFGSLYLVGEAYRYWGYGDDRLPSFSKRASTVVEDAFPQPNTPTPPRDEDRSVQSHPQRGLRAFLHGRWFPEGRLDPALAAQSRLPIMLPRITATMTAFAGLFLMTVVYVALGSHLSLYAGLALGTVVGNLLVAYVAASYLRVSIFTPLMRVSTVLAAIAMGAVFSLTAALMTGVLSELYSVLLEGSSLGEIWEEFLVSREESYDELLSPTTRLGWAAALVTISFLPGICEEYLFRGVLYRMMEGVSTWRRVIFIGVLFGAIHFDPAGLIPLCILGGALTWLRALSGSWVMPAVVHIAFNATALMMAMSPALESLDEDSGLSAAMLIPFVLASALSVLLFVRFGRSSIAADAAQVPA